MEKKQVWEKVKDRGLNTKFEQDFIDLIDQYLDRIEFVKDHVGLRDVVFVAEKNCDYKNNFFVALDVDASRHNTYEKNNDLFEKALETRELIALSELEKAFKETNRKIYLGIGFSESATYDQVEVINKVLNGPPKSDAELLKDLRSFPEWYDKHAKYPEELNFIPKQIVYFISEYLEPVHQKELRNKVKEKFESRESQNEKMILKELISELDNII